jgi:hypothetical protein
MSKVWLGEQRNAGPFLTTQEVYVMKREFSVTVKDVLKYVEREQREITHSVLCLQSDPSYYAPQSENLRQAAQHIVQLASMIEAIELANRHKVA